METVINAWLSVWLYVMAAIGIVLAVRIWKNRKVWDEINILCALAIIVFDFARFGRMGNSGRVSLFL